MLGSTASRATTYEVGPGKPLATPSEVPWESLAPGDTVLIYWRSEPYKDKWVICRQGSQGQPITVRGVPGPGGELPVIDGNGAVTRTQLNFWNEARGLIKIGGANTPSDTMPRYIVIENLDLRSARPPYSFTGRDGVTAYAQNTAAIYIEKGEHITIRNCVLRDSGNGLFAGAQTTDLLVEGNSIYDNGNEGSMYEHNNYTEVLGIVFQYNYFGPLRAGCNGNNLKDRSAGTVIRYNWIEGGNRQLDLVDAEDSTTLLSAPSYRTTLVYGNILVEPDGAGNSQIVHYGGDSGNLAWYRKGTLYFYNNTVVSTRTGNTTLLRLSSSDEHADVRNNILYVTAAGSNLAIFDGQGTVDLSNNWLKTGWRECHCTPTGSVNDLGSQVVGANPGLADLSAGDYRLTEDSPCRNAAGPLASGVPPVEREYVKHQGSMPRPSDGLLDIGAFEYCGPGCDADGGLVADAGPPGDSGTSADGGTSTDGGAPGDGSTTTDAGPQPDASPDGGATQSSGGCGCVLSARGPHVATCLVAALLVVLLGRRRPGRP